MRFVHTRLSKLAPCYPLISACNDPDRNRTICHKVNKSGLGQTSSFM
uniref:Uncharacterized protein n=1 Tax=Anguilla anguilla TaxID=7936 RepID=A0A0E9W668_ANGAN